MWRTLKLISSLQWRSGVNSVDLHLLQVATSHVRSVCEWLYLYLQQASIYYNHQSINRKHSALLINRGICRRLSIKVGVIINPLPHMNKCVNFYGNKSAFIHNQAMKLWLVSGGWLFYGWMLKVQVWRNLHWMKGSNFH